MEVQSAVVDVVAHQHLLCSALQFKTMYELLFCKVEDFVKNKTWWKEEARRENTLCSKRKQELCSTSEL